MVVDTSAIFAAIANEPDADRFRQAMMQAPTLKISAVTLLEARIVVFSRPGEEVAAALDQVVEEAEIFVAPFDAGAAAAAFDAFTRFGKGQGHPAQLNIVDCAAYALAKTLGEPLLFKGGDFAKTDVERVP